MHSPFLFLTTLLFFYSFSRSPSSACALLPSWLLPLALLSLSSLLTFSLSCPPSVTVIRGDRGDQRRRRRTSSTDLSPPSPSAPCAKFASFELSCCSFSSLPRFLSADFALVRGTVVFRQSFCVPSSRRAISERASVRRVCVSLG